MIRLSTTIFYITQNGKTLAEKINFLYPAAEIKKFSPEAVRLAWRTGARLIFITAAGIVVRAIAPLVKDKKTDPAVVVLDEKARHVISLLSGHLGGANSLAIEIAEFLCAEPVITTASDINGLVSIDMWAAENSLVIEDWEALPQVATKYLNNGMLLVYNETSITLPSEFESVKDPDFADLLITDKKSIHSEAGASKSRLYLRPMDLVVGIGCNSSTSEDEIESAVKETLENNNLSFMSIKCLATIDIKTSETGLVSFAEKFGLPIVSFSAQQLNSVAGIEKSEAVFRATGAHAVSEPAALLASDSQDLLVRKQKLRNVTIAIARAAHQKKMNKTKEERRGTIYIVGTGPGSYEQMTQRAVDAIISADVVIGYGTYLAQIEDLLKDREVISTGMTQEIDRCRRAVEEASKGRLVVVVSGGDPGIYAMAGLVLELLKADAADIDVEVVPGVSAINACAALLGAPLMHDFASISLSDRLTPWELIEKRLDAAASADFVIALYNPRSMGRQEHINRAAKIIMRHRDPATPVGIVKAAYRENQEVIVTDLAHMTSHNIDMQTTVIIGNSRTTVFNNMMITPRGYRVE
ncbi:MAG: precorrin-3B C(17)-methyltransferase [Nitrospiraceae bacterium]|nr:precorrin-3B C(17)-methyltransferase [Nitrospiraceae bacterium]